MCVWGGGGGGHCSLLSLREQSLSIRETKLEVNELGYETMGFSMTK